MTTEQVLALVEGRWGILPDYPWKDGNRVLRHPENRKWFALLMSVKGRSVGLPQEEAVSLLNVKCDPLLLGSLRMEKGFRPAYHMNKEQWLTLLLEQPGSSYDCAPDALVEELLSLSFDLTAPKGKRKPTPSKADEAGGK